MTARPRRVAVLLAAGAARRYGSAKQMARHGEQSFVRGAAEAALTLADELIVVTGAHAALVEAEVADLRPTLLPSPDWSLGMGHSMAAAFRYLLQRPDAADAALLCLADQPLVRAVQLRRLVDAAAAHPAHRIIASDYGPRRGPPCLFPACDFAALAQLEGDTGARRLLDDNRSRVVTVSMPEAALDIDTPEDYASLRNLR